MSNREQRRRKKRDTKVQKNRKNEQQRVSRNFAGKGRNRGNSHGR